MQSTRSGDVIRGQMLAGVLGFVRAVAPLAGVRRIALIGSIITLKPTPKDLLVTITDDTDLAPLARCARQLQGRLQGLNHWQTCSWLMRAGDTSGVRVRGASVGRVFEHPVTPFTVGEGRTHDDLGDVRVNQALTASPPVEIWPTVIRRTTVPPDVEHLLATIDHAV